MKLGNIQAPFKAMLKILFELSWTFDEIENEIEAFYKEIMAMRKEVTT